MFELLTANDREITRPLSLRASMPEIVHTLERRCTSRKSERYGSDFQSLREAARILLPVITIFVYALCTRKTKQDNTVYVTYPT